MSLVSLEASIKTEAKKNAKLVTDIDNFRNRYVDSDFENSIEVIFPSFDILTFDKNYFSVLSTCRRVKFKSRWYMRPDYVSFDMYNTTIYWPLILYINNIYTREDFINLDSILIPPYSAIFKLYTSRTVDKKLINIQEIPDETFTNQFYRTYPMDAKEFEGIDSDNALTNSEKQSDYGVYNTEKSESITLTVNDIKNKYIDLQHIPTNASTISLRLNNLSINQRYNYDYTLIYNGSNELKRISWNSSDIITNSSNPTIVANMANYLRIGTVVKLTYSISVAYLISDGVPSV
jgi:hypothetical protein